MQGYPPPHGYPPPYGYPPPPPRSGMSALTIVLIVVVVLLVLGGGGCLVCVGAAALLDDGEHGTPATPTGAPTAAQTRTLVRDKMAIDLETRLRQQGVPATSVLCPQAPEGDFDCELTVGADRAAIVVKRGPTGFAFDVPNTAFLAGDKLATFFQTNIASKIDPRLKVACFTGTLMKAVGSTFTCDVTSGGAPAGKVDVSVSDAAGNVKMDYVATRTVPLATPPAQPSKGPRVVDFVCPPGQAPGGAVRAGCLCGSEILGTACGAPGNFVDVTATPRGCRFVCQ